MTLRRGASIETLKQRASLLSKTRAFFAARGVAEVETASLSAAATPDPALHSLRAATGQRGTFLHTSPEYMMKRLVAGGSGDIWQLCRVYRDAEIGRWHEPEFSLLEWYRIGFDEHALMDEIDALLKELLPGDKLRETTERMSYDAALHHAVGLDSGASAKDLHHELCAHEIDVPRDMSHGEMLDLAMSTLICPRLPADRLTFIHDYPQQQAALAELNPGNPPTAARFEVFIGELELGNGFRELTDATEQRRRFEAENAARAQAGLEPMPLDEAFLQALGEGLPACAGVALGFDRVVAAAVGAERVADVVAFTHAPSRPRSDRV